MSWTAFQTREDYQQLPVAKWTREECLDWLISEGVYTCAMSEALLDEELRWEVNFQINEIGWEPPE